MIYSEFENKRRYYLHHRLRLKGCRIRARRHMVYVPQDIYDSKPKKLLYYLNTLAIFGYGIQIIIPENESNEN